MTSEDASDTVEITQLIQRWGFCRDQGRWEDLAQTFTTDGTISVTWFTGRFADFISASVKAYKPVSPRVKHLIGLPVVDLNGNKAVAETNIQILGRFSFGDTEVDNTSFARFVDRLVKTDAGWRIQSRIAIYEKDRLDPIIPSSGFERQTAETDFTAVPEPYRYLGHRLLTTGRSLHDGIICDGTPQAHDALLQAQAWLWKIDETAHLP
tara:strand:- start:1727 stop:2353 length:627 start_codon:yes stop_codon:yes gene_type:complete